MPEALRSSEVDSRTDPTVAKQYDNSSSSSEKFKDLYTIIDKLKIGLLGTTRSGTGLVARSMAVAKRDGPDLVFIANKNSKKFEDIRQNKECSITFQNSSSQDWVSITGKVTTADNNDPRIKELYSLSTSAWFGDLGDGVHNGKAEDPRMALIEVEATYIVYWKAQVGALGYMKEVAEAALTGKVADVGVLRELSTEEIQNERAGGK